jgi:hypothetical protein
MRYRRRSAAAQRASRSSPGHREHRRLAAGDIPRRIVAGTARHRHSSASTSREHALERYTTCATTRRTSSSPPQDSGMMGAASTKVRSSISEFAGELIDADLCHLDSPRGHRIVSLRD